MAHEQAGAGVTGRSEVTSREAVEAFIRAFTTRTFDDVTEHTYVGVCDYAGQELSDWLKHNAADRFETCGIPDIVYGRFAYTDIDEVDREWAVAELLRFAEITIREAFAYRLQ